MIDQLQRIGFAAIPLVTAFTFASIFFTSMRFVGNRLSPDTNANIELWLKGDYQDSWLKIFCDVFDKVFGKKHLSLKTFFRSAIVSISSVFVLYFIFSTVFQVLGSRTPSNISLIKVLIIGGILNIIPDYISLFETRWILKKFSKFSSFIGNLGILFLDLVISATIILSSIYLFQHFRGEEINSWIELVAIFSIYSIFFYSTFITSVWSWLFFISKWFVALISKTKLRTWLDLKTNPMATIGAVGAILIFVFSLLITPQITTDKNNDITAFDEFLCKTFPSEICQHHARRLSSDEEKALDYLTKSCEAGNIDECINIAYIYYENERVNAYELLAKACYNERVTACLSIAKRDLEGINVAQNIAKAIQIYKEYCQKTYYSACSSYSQVYSEGIYVDKDLSKAISIIEPYCDDDSFHEISCVTLGNIYILEYANDDQKIDQVKKWYERLCTEQNECTHLASLYYNGIGYEKNLDKVLTLLKPYCLALEGNEPDAMSCYLSGLALYEISDAPLAREASAISFWAACRMSSDIGCRRLAYAYLEGTGIERNIDRAISLLEHSCKVDDPSACLRLSIIYRTGSHVERSLSKGETYAQKACKLKDEYACFLVNKLYTKNPNVPNYWASALNKYEANCNRGDGYSCYWAGLIYNNGDSGIADNNTAANYFTLSCKYADEYGCFELAYMNEYGLGIPRDAIKAEELYEIACNAELAPACYHLGLMYKQEKGVVAPKSKIYLLLEQACNGKFKSACDELDVKVIDKSALE